MTRALPIVLSTLLWLPPAAFAQEESSWLFGLEVRVGESEPDFASDHQWSVIPNFSHFLSERLRLDGFLGLGYTDSDNYSLWAMPGLRYYHGDGPGPLRFNSGFSVGFELLESERRDVAVPPDFREDIAHLRLVPLEMEYWHGRRSALTLGLDYETDIEEGGRLGDGGFGVSAGFRIRLK